jgi:hypothetical protein
MARMTSRDTAADGSRQRGRRRSAASRRDLIDQVAALFTPREHDVVERRILAGHSKPDARVARVATYAILAVSEALWLPLLVAVVAVVVLLLVRSLDKDS